MPSVARLQSLAAALPAQITGTPRTAAAQSIVPSPQAAVDAELRGGAEAAELTAAEVELAEQ